MTGLVMNSTKYIIQEYKIKFPFSKILLVTWTSENVEGLDCEVLQIEKPSWLKQSESNSPYQFPLNIQILQVTNGLKNIDCDIVMRCRSDQFIHNSNIFDIYFENCGKEKIMIPRSQYKEDEFQIIDYCMIARKEVMNDFWNNQPFFDGSYYTSVEEYIVKNYIQKFNKDFRPWSEVKTEYFFEQDYDKIFQIEWEKLVMLDEYQVKFRNKLIRESFY
jgi:hypothetical protein